MSVKYVPVQWNRNKWLYDAVLVALANAEMAGETYLVADPEPLSPAEMVKAFRAGWNRRSGLLPLPPGPVAMAARMAGRGDAVERLRQRLVVDPAKLLAAGWTPRRSSFDALVETARAYG